MHLCIGASAAQYRNRFFQQLAKIHLQHLLDGNVRSVPLPAVVTVAVVTYVEEVSQAFLPSTTITISPFTVFLEKYSTSSGSVPRLVSSNSLEISLDTLA